MEGVAATAGVSSADKQNEATSSYTYWVRGATQDAAPLPVPKKLTSEDLNNQANNPQTHLGSAWNRVLSWMMEEQVDLSLLEISWGVQGNKITDPRQWRMNSYPFSVALWELLQMRCLFQIQTLLEVALVSLITENVT
ncbi:hypothetical protein K7X08_020185 [Anisodus acutangulus]|uniref:Uncharacterized protein n=1 Tax=Anisodus acutangulus TaxID=402998 RepID=A0A9Q1M868_9SOLA|nr:hypothetical protein K7X08_020185 [Anisodus acutangulus]